MFCAFCYTDPLMTGRISFFGTPGISICSECVEHYASIVGKIRLRAELEEDTLNEKLKQELITNLKCE